MFEQTVLTSMTELKQLYSWWQSINPAPGVAATNPIESEYQSRQVRSFRNKELHVAARQKM
jgi:hypothetical protein